MAGALPHYKLGPASYIAGKPILGGTLVRAASASESGVPAALQGASVVPNDSATSVTLLGVAATDVGVSQYPEGTPATSGSWAGNAPNGTDTNLDVSTLGYTVAVYNNIDIKVKYSAAASFGQKLYADANGGVNVTNTGTPVGFCSQPGGVASGAVGRAFIRV